MEMSITIGMDLGDRKHTVCVLGADGVVLEEMSVASAGGAVRGLLMGYPGALVAMETGTHSRWVSQIAEELGLRVLVGNARKLRAIWTNPQKSDLRDAEMIARIARMDPQLLHPIHHRSARSQQDLSVIKARDALVKIRTALVLHVRSVIKGTGRTANSSSSRAFAAKVEIPEELREALEPLRQTLEHLNEQINAYDRKIKELAKAYPQTECMTQVQGVGTLTALAYVLTVEDAERFTDSRMAGAYLGLTPRRDQSGKTDKQLPITKAGNAYMRSLLVNCAHYILGPFGKPCHLRAYGERVMLRGGKNAKKRAVVAVARKLAVLLHALWRSGKAYEPTRHMNQAA